MTMHEALHPRDELDYKCREKEEGDSPALKIAWMHQYCTKKNKKDV